MMIPSFQESRPTQDQVLLGTARQFEQRSTCSRNQVGAVIARDGRIISTGYNGAPAGMAHCDHSYPGQGTEINFGRMHELTQASQSLIGRGCVVAIHAEANAIAYAARHGVSVHGGTVYTTLSPCYACSQLIVAAGLTRVVYGRPYRDPSGLTLLREAGLTVEMLA